MPLRVSLFIFNEDEWNHNGNVPLNLYLENKINRLYINCDAPKIMRSASVTKILSLYLDTMND